jgi:hypothetical protein
LSVLVTGTFPRSGSDALPGNEKPPAERQEVSGERQLWALAYSRRRFRVVGVITTTV